MKTVFVTACGTGVGKTVVTAILCRQLAAKGLLVRAVKPIISGYTEEEGGDTHLLMEAQGLPDTPDSVDRVSPWRFRAPMSPDMAARREGRYIDFEALLAFCEDCRKGPEDLLLIEGIGGAMVPLTDHRTVRDWIAALDVPVLLATGSYLGSLSHGLTTAEALAHRGIETRAVIVSQSLGSPVPLDETVETFQRFLEGVRVIALPRLLSFDCAPDLTQALG